MVGTTYVVRVAEGDGTGATYGPFYSLEEVYSWISSKDFGRRLDVDVEALEVLSPGEQWYRANAIKRALERKGSPFEPSLESEFFLQIHRPELTRFGMEREKKAWVGGWRSVRDEVWKRYRRVFRGY